MALGVVAGFCEEHFKNYYDFVMPYLKTTLLSASDKSDHILQSKALMCISFVGMAVGKEKFKDDLKQVMEVLKSLQESQVKEFYTFAGILQAWCRICGCIGKEFLHCTSIVMPPLLEYAQLEPDKTIPLELDDSIHTVKFLDETISISGKGLSTLKALACNTIDIFADELEEDFYPWISQAASVVVPLLKFYFDDDVRHAACSAISSLLRSAKLAVEKGIAHGGKEYFKQLSSSIILAMGDALYSEPMTNICAIILSELDECLEMCAPLLNKDQVHSIIDVIKHVIRESSHRKGKLTEREKTEDFDAEEAELLREEREQEVEVFSNVGDILCTLIETFKAEFLPFIDELSSYLMPYMTGKDKTATERATCILIFDKLVENCGVASLKYYSICLPFLLESSNDEDPDVRQGALYGLRLCIEYGGSIFKPFVGEALSRINVVLRHFNALEPENIWAYDNAVSALGKICQFHQESIDPTQIVPSWLNSLPIRVDVDEAKEVHDQLCLMLERSDRDLLGPKYEHFPKIVSVFAEVLCAGEVLATKETAKRMKKLLKKLKKTLPPAIWESAWPLLLPQQEMELESILRMKQRQWRTNKKGKNYL